MRRVGMALALVVMALFGFGLFSLPVFAQQQPDERGISISPLVFELSANPGDKLKHTLRVHNPTDRPVSLVAQARNFTAMGEEGQPALTEEDTTYSLANWVTITPSEKVVQPNAQTTFDFFIDPPINAEPGGHFGSIVIKTKPVADKDSDQVAIVQEVAALVLLKIAGDIKEGAQIATFKASANFYEKGPFRLLTRLQNTGNVHFKPRATITITNMFGQKTGTLNIDERNVLPDSIRRFENAWKPTGLQIGRYTATLSVVYGTHGQILTATTTFWVFPWKAVLVVLATLSLLGLIGWKYKDRFVRAYRALAGK